MIVRVYIRLLYSSWNKHYKIILLNGSWITAYFYVHPRESRHSCT